MSSKWKSRRLKVAAALVFLVGPGIGIASAQTTTPTAQVIQADTTKEIKATPSAVPAGDEARLKKFLDKDGGYKDKLGGYYNPKAGTYTDKDGGVVDNWQGYTYKDGSYKSKNGDYFDAPNKTVHLASGDVFKSPDGTTNDDVVKILRGNVEDSGGYDKDYIRRTMMAQVKKEHPPSPPLATTP